MWKKPNRNYISKYVRYNSLRLGYRERKYNTLIFYHYIIARSFFCFVFLLTYYSVLHAMKTILTCYTSFMYHLILREKRTPYS